jgi:hypothetical protein
MRLRRSDLDFPVLMLRGSAWPPTVATVGVGPEGQLSTVGISYSDGDATLQLETLARRGRRMGPYGPLWVADQITDIAAKAVTGLHLEAIRPGSQPAPATRQAADDAVRLGQQAAGQLPGPPWQVRSVPVNDVEFAMWTATFAPGFAAVLDYGPVVLGASGTDLDTWTWHLTATQPDAAWPLISEAIDTD